MSAKNGSTQLLTLALIIIALPPSAATSRSFAMPFGRSSPAFSSAKRAQAALKSSVLMPLKQCENTFCLAFQLG